MDDRTRQMIEAYIPHPRDTSLEDGEYFYLQGTLGGDRVIRVFALDILPHRDGTEYGIYQKKGARLVRIDSGWGDPNRGVTMGYLYDNAQDCRDQTHNSISWWEDYRIAQEEDP